jgi:dihydroorotase
MSSFLLKNGIVVTDGVSKPLDVLVKDKRIERLDSNIDDPDAETIDLEGKLLLPGCIDDQVHFREPGLTHKANIFSESRAAVAGGITSFMEMPNTKPNAVTQELLEDKYKIAQTSSLANYSFFYGGHK